MIGGEIQQEVENVQEEFEGCMEAELKEEDLVDPGRVLRPEVADGKVEELVEGKGFHKGSMVPRAVQKDQQIQV